MHSTAQQQRPGHHLFIATQSHPTTKHDLALFRKFPISSCPHQPIEEGPRKHESAQPPKDVTQPHVTERSVVVFRRLRIRLERKQKHRDERRGDEVEDEAGVRFETERAGGDAEEGGGQVTDVGRDLRLSACWMGESSKTWWTADGRQRTGEGGGGRV